MLSHIKQHKILIARKRQNNGENSSGSCVQVNIRRKKTI